MKKSNVLAALAVLGLCAATTSPAQALENEFHGLFSARYINSNFNGTATTDFATDPISGANVANGFYQPDKSTRKQYSANFIEQRARLQYIAKANQDLKLITHFELDYTYWGNSSYVVGRNQGGAIGADTVNIETKNIYLDANPFKNVNLKLGMMPSADAFKGVLFDADMAGILVSSSYGKFTPSIGYYRFNDTGAGRDGVLGHLTNDMFMLDGKFEVAKNFKVGAAYYFFRDNKAGTAPAPDNDVKIHSFGLNAEYVTGPLTLNGFAIYQTGWNNTLLAQKTYVNAYAGNLGAKLNVGPGTARTEFLYVSGSDNGKNSFYSVDGENGYYSNEMTILGRDKNAYTIDNSILFNSGNKGQGQIGAFLGYDLPVSPKLTTAANVGFAWIAHKNGNSYSQTNGTNFLGTEINGEATYQLLDGFSCGVRAGYVILGGQFDNVATNGTPENPYDAKLIFTYTF